MVRLKGILESKMNKPQEVLEIFKKYTPIIDQEIMALLDSKSNLLLYDMMRYFFGFLNEDLSRANNYGGKRFRPGICLLISDFYNLEKKVIGAATAIEIFHNFTLIHDDIEDRDEIRRGRPTLWSKWGLAHGINTGDSQLILANTELVKNYKDEPVLFTKISEFLTDIYSGVAEGQYLDFTLAEKGLNDSFVCEDKYLEMIEKKSAILVAASAKVPGIIGDLGDDEQKLLWEYGLNLGFAYQLVDDIASIWGDQKNTGKVESGDIKEKKKTLPIIFLYNSLSGEEKIKLVDLYNSTADLNDEEVGLVKGLLDREGVESLVWKKIEEYLNRSQKAINSLSISSEQKEMLHKINSALIVKPSGVA